MNKAPDNPQTALEATAPEAQVDLTRYDDRALYQVQDQQTYNQDQNESESVDWSRLLAILRRRRKVMLLTLAACLIIAVLYLATAPRIYRASTDLLLNVNNKNNFRMNDQIQAISELLSSTGARNQETEVEILRSASVYYAAVELLDEPMQKRISRDMKVVIQPKRSTDIIVVSVLGKDSEAAVALSNSLCEAYRRMSRESDREQYRGTSNYVGQQLEKVRRTLTEKREQLKKYKEENDVVDLPSEVAARVTRLGTLTAELQQTEGDISAATAQLTQLRSQASQLAPAEINPETLVARPIVVQLKQQLTSLESQRITAAQEFTPTSPEIRALDDQIAALKRRLSTEAATEVGTFRRNVNPVRQAVVQAISQTSANVKALQARASATRAEIGRSREEVKTLPEKEFRLSQLQSDLATYQQTFQNLSANYNTLKISEQVPVASARVITAASKGYLVSPRVPVTLALALLLGLILALSVAIVVDMVDDKIYNEEDAQQATGLPVLTHVPLLSGDTSESLLHSENRSAILLESFRMLRTQLAFASFNGQMKTYLVTSSQPHEGKSTVAANLATALALNEKSVILVDCDLRRPRVHRLFDVANTRGLSSVVAGLCTVDEAIQETTVQGLRILTSGPTPPNPPELLDSKPCREVLAQLKDKVDFVILDAPPGLVLADAQIAASMADGVLLVVSCREAGRRAVERTCELLSQTGTKVLGIILNKFTAQAGGYYNYYGYNYQYNSYLREDKDEENYSESAPLAKKK